MSLFGSLFGAEAQKAREAAVGIIATRDPDAMGKAAMIEQGQEVSKAAAVVSTHIIAYQQLEQAFKGYSAAFDTNYQAMQALAKASEGVEDGPKKAALGQKFAVVKTALDDARAHRDEAKKHLDEEGERVERYKQSHQAAVKKLSTIKQTVEDAKHAQEDAIADERDQIQREHDEKVMAGLESHTNGMDSALSALKDSANKHKREAEAHRLTADALAGTHHTSDDLAAILEETKHMAEPATSSMSLSEQMAALAK